MQVTRKECDFANVGGLSEASDPTFESDGESAMWGHAVAERFEVSLERCKVLTGECCQLVGVVV